MAYKKERATRRLWLLDWDRSLLDQNRLDRLQLDSMSSLLSSIHLPSASSSKSKASPSLPSTATFGSPPSASSSAPQQPTPTPATAVQTFRQLVFGGSIPIHLEIATDELPAGADRSVESYYLQAPRIAYLPLLLPRIQKYFLDLILDDPSVTATAGIKMEDLWFSYQGVPLRWHWPIGLLYDYHTSSTSSPSSSGALPTSLASVFASPSRSSSPSPSLDQRTLRSRNVGSTVSGTVVAGPLPWKLTLHVKNPPSDVLLMGSSVEGCRGSFMNMVKEADYVRWGSVKRVTNLRKEQQDGLWEGVVSNDFDRFWSIFSKLVPLPAATSPSSSRSPTPIGGPSPAPGSSIPTDGRLPDANAVRSVPMRVYLPEGAPVLQEVVPPLVDGHPQTLYSYLRASLPLFFPSSSSSSSFSPPLAIPIIHGVAVPLESELGWLGAGMCGADGWVAVVLRLG